MTHRHVSTPSPVLSSVPSSVMVLHEAVGDDPRPDELDTLAQAEQVSAALRGMGIESAALATGLDLGSTLNAIRGRRPDVVFNLVESLGGDGRLVHVVPSLLATSGIPFTGSDGDAIFLSSHKRLAKRVMHQHGIPTAEVLEEGGSDDDPDDDPDDDVGGSWIVKSLWEHASFGLDDGCVVDGVGAAHRRIAESVRRHGGEWFAERYVDGREFNVSVLEVDGAPQVLPLAEMTFVDYPAGKPRIVGYAAKWDESAPEYHATKRVFPALSAELRDAITGIVGQCWSAFGLRGYARVDFRIDDEQRPWVLEINANPCIAEDAGFTATAAEAGIGFERLVTLLLEAALRQKHVNS
ncbi:MAG: D-alanine--D-alanine ligase family protein [Lysobacterales bacterium]